MPVFQASSADCVDTECTRSRLRICVTSFFVSSSHSCFIYSSLEPDDLINKGKWWLIFYADLFSCLMGFRTITSADVSSRSTLAAALAFGCCTVLIRPMGRSISWTTESRHIDVPGRSSCETHEFGHAGRAKAIVTVYGHTRRSA